MGEHDPRAVLFDVDGTLVDSERQGHRVAFNRAFEEAGMADRWGEDHYGRLLAVAGGRQRLRHYLVGQGRDEAEADELATKLHARKTALFRAMVADGEIPERPGARRLMDELAAAGVPVGVATTGSREWVEPLLERLFGRERFVVELTSAEVPDRKPSPAIYERALDELSLEPGEVVVIEDSANGITAATVAGLPCVAVVNDYTRQEVVGSSGDGGGAAELVVDAFGDPGRAEVLAGPDDLLDDGAVTLRTLRALAG